MTESLAGSKVSRHPRGPPRPYSKLDDSVSVSPSTLVLPPLTAISRVRADSEPPTLADNDLFAGIRLALNDAQDSDLLAGVGYDLKTSETYVNVEAERRLGDDYVVELRARFFTNAEPGDTSYAIEKDDYLQLQLSRYF